MGIVSDRETPRMVAALVHHNQPSASFRLDLVVELLRQLCADCRNNGFPNAAKVLALGEAAAADAASVGQALDHALALREAAALARVKDGGEDISLNQARAEVAAPADHELDATLDRSRSALALGQLEDAAEQLEHEGASR